MGLADQIRTALDAKRAETAEAWTIFEARRDELTKTDGALGDEQIDELNGLHETYKTLADEEENLEGRWEKVVPMDGSLYRKASTNGFADVKDETPTVANSGRIWTPGQRFVESEQYKGLVASGSLRTERARVATAPVEVWTREEVKNFGKATTITAAELHGTLVQPDRLPGLTAFPLPMPRVLGMINRSTTDTDTVEWVTVTAFDNQAAETAEEAAKPQSDLTFGVIQSPVQTIAHWIAATRQALADASRLSDEIDTYLRAGIEQRLELQILKGNGTAPNLRGILNTAGILTSAYSTNPVESIFASINAIRAQQYEPNAILMNPADMAAVRLGKDTTGNYYYGPPSIAGPATMWGLPIATSVNVTAGTALVGDFTQATLWTREGVTVVASSEHADFFIKNMVAILGEGRFAFGVRTPKAFCVADLTA